MKLYRVLLEINGKSGNAHLPRYVQAENIDAAWTEAQKRGAEYNQNHRSKCVVHSVKFQEANQCTMKNLYLGGNMIFKGDKITVSNMPGVFEVTGFDTTHYFAADKNGVVYRFRRTSVKAIVSRFEKPSQEAKP